MARTQKHQQKSATRWPVNGQPSPNTTDAKEPVDVGATIDALAATNAPTSDALTTSDAWATGDATSTMVVDAPVEARSFGPTHLDDRDAVAAIPMSPAIGHSIVDIEPAFGSLDEDPFDTLPYTPPGPRQPRRDDRWAASLRRYGRAVVWCLPVGVVALTLTTLWTWPTPAEEPNGASPGTWLVITILGGALWLAGVTAIAALLATTPGRVWGASAVVGTTAGMVLLLPVLGVVGLARPAVTRTTHLLGAEAAAALHEQFLGGAVGRWLAIGGLTLLGAATVVLGLAILASDVFSRMDGWCTMLGVAVAGVSAYLGWPFLLTLAGMVFLAGMLGVAWNASRLTADGRIADQD